MRFVIHAVCLSQSPLCHLLGMTCIILNVGLYVSPTHLLCFQETLQKDFGSKTGSMLWNYSRGIDDRLVGMIQVRIYKKCLTLLLLFVGFLLDFCHSHITDSRTPIDSFISLFLIVLNIGDLLND